MEIHNTALKKDASEILETNSTDATLTQYKNELQPVVTVEPYLNIVRAISASGTIYTTPTDKDFYLTNIHLTGSTAGTDGIVQISIIPRDGVEQYFNLQINGDGILGNSSNVSDMVFPMRGILLAKSSNIVVTVTTDNGQSTIVGYLGSDRSGI